DRVTLKLQEDLDDFSGIPDGYLQSIADQTSSSNSGNNNSRVNTNNRSSNSNDNYDGQSSGETKILKSDDETQELISSNSDLSTTQLRMLNATQVNADVSGKKIGIKTPIFIATNRIHNLMFIRTSDEQAMSDIENLINKSDKPTPQVLLETKILRISRGESFDQDFDLSYKSAVQTPKTGSNTGITLDEIRDAAVTGAGFSGVTGGFYEYYSKYINAKIELLEEKDMAEIIAKPILLASNNRPSRLFIGEDQVIAVGIRAGNTSTTTSDNDTTRNRTATKLDTEVR
ncbi:MAG: hypothetical protein ACKVJE_22825, partial [Pseudomonadales bacterium]